MELFPRTRRPEAGFFEQISAIYQALRAVVIGQADHAVAELLHPQQRIRPRSVRSPVLQVDVDGEVWTVEVGQPWRNERAGLRDGDLSEGAEIRVIGEPSGDESERRLKVERLFLGGQEYILYPGRD